MSPSQPTRVATLMSHNNEEPMQSSLYDANAKRGLDHPAFSAAKTWGDALLKKTQHNRGTLQVRGLEHLLRLAGW